MRAYMEHGMHKLPQPVKLWYLSSYFRNERPQAGRYRQFWQIGVEAIGSAEPAVDAEVILLLAEILEAIGVRDVKLLLATLGQPESRAAYREELAGLPASQRGPADAERSSTASTSTRCAPSTPSTSPRSGSWRRRRG